MGAQLVSAAVSTALPHLRSDRSRTVLLVMALVALDTDEQPVYFGGSDHLARCLGYGHVATCTGCSRRQDGRPRSTCDPAGERAVRRALAELEAADLIRQATDGSGRRVGNRHHNRRWELTLAPRAAPVENNDAAVAPERTSSTGPDSTQESGRGSAGGQPGPVGSGQPSPHQRNQLEEPQEEETPLRPTAALAAPVTDRAREHDDDRGRGKAAACRDAIAAAALQP